MRCRGEGIVTGWRTRAVAGRSIRSPPTNQRSSLRQSAYMAFLPRSGKCSTVAHHLGLCRGALRDGLRHGTPLRQQRLQYGPRLWRVDHMCTARDTSMCTRRPDVVYTGMCGRPCTGLIDGECETAARVLCCCTQSCDRARDRTTYKKAPPRWQTQPAVLFCCVSCTMCGRCMPLVHGKQGFIWGAAHPVGSDWLQQHSSEHAWSGHPFTCSSVRSASQHQQPPRHTLSHSGVWSPWSVVHRSVLLTLHKHCSLTRLHKTAQ